jgi:hypothetical protein
MKSAAAKGKKLFRLAAAALLAALVLAPQIATADTAGYPETRLRAFGVSEQVGDQVDSQLSRLSQLGYRHSYDEEVVGSLLVPRRAAGPSTLHARGRRIGEPIMVSPNEMQSIAKSVRRHVQKLNKRGINSSGERYLDLLAEGDYRAAGAIAHGRMFKRLNSREFLTLNGEKVLINRGRIHPPPGTTSPYGYSYRIPDIQYGSPGTAGFKMWDFKGIHGGWPYTDPTGQFADLAAWTGSRPSALFYHWR